MRVALTTTAFLLILAGPGSPTSGSTWLERGPGTAASRQSASDRSQTTPAAAPLNGLERRRLVAHMEMTEPWLVDEVSGLSPAQLAFRPEAGAWNILDVLDHLVVVAPIYWLDLQQALKTAPIAPAAAPNDASVLWYGIDRTERQKAIPGEVPKGTIRDLRSGLERYRAAHRDRLRYARTTTDSLRSHIVAREGCDAYQWLLLISTHEQRHILQIREIKAHEDFPRR
jgi:hypothetical protein